VPLAHTGSKSKFSRQTCGSFSGVFFHFSGSGWLTSVFTVSCSANPLIPDILDFNSFGIRELRPMIEGISDSEQTI
jgi:hypothetical protein